MERGCLSCAPNSHELAQGGCRVSATHCHIRAASPMPPRTWLSIFRACMLKACTGAKGTVAESCGGTEQDESAPVRLAPLLHLQRACFAIKAKLTQTFWPFRPPVHGEACIKGLRSSGMISALHPAAAQRSAEAHTCLPMVSARPPALSRLLRWSSRTKVAVITTAASSTVPMMGNRIQPAPRWSRFLPKCRLR